MMAHDLIAAGRYAEAIDYNQTVIAPYQATEPKM